MVFCIICVGMAMVTAVIRVRRPARERAKAFQFASLEWSLSMTKLKVHVFRLLVRMGTPRYFPKSLQALISSSLLAAIILSGEVRGESKSWILRNLFSVQIESRIY